MKFANIKVISAETTSNILFEPTPAQMRGNHDQKENKVSWYHNENIMH